MPSPGFESPGTGFGYSKSGQSACSADIAYQAQALNPLVPKHFKRVVENLMMEHRPITRAPQEALMPAQTRLSKSNIQRWVSYHPEGLCRAGAVGISSENCLHSLWSSESELSRVGQEDLGWS
jgi:hypothetical protein